MRKVIGYGINIKVRGDEESIGFYNTAEEAAAILPTLVLEYMDRMREDMCDYPDESINDSIYEEDHKGMFYRCRYWPFTNCPPAHKEHTYKSGECIYVTREELIKHFLANKYYEPCLYFKFRLLEIKQY